MYIYEIQSTIPFGVVQWRVVVEIKSSVVEKIVWNSTGFKVCNTIFMCLLLLDELYSD